LKKVLFKLTNNLFRKGNPTFQVQRPINKNPNPKQIEFDNAVIMN